MKLNLYHLFLCALWALSLMGCPSQTLEKPAPPAGSFVYGGEGTQSGNGLLELPDGSILIVGASRSRDDEDYDVLLAKINPNGTEAWSRTYRKPDTEDSGYEIVPIASGYIIAGFSRSSFNSPNRVLMMELDQNFDLVRDREVSSSSINSRRSSIVGLYVLGNGNYLLGLGLESGHSYLTVNADFSLESQAVASSGLSFNNAVKSPFIQQMPDGGFVLGITENNTTTFAAYPQVVRLNANGEEIWRKDYDSLVDGNAYSLTILGVAARSNGHALLNLYPNLDQQILLEIDSGGAVVDTSHLGNTPEYAFFDEHPDGSLALAGYTGITWGGSNPGVNFSLAGLDANGTQTFTEEFGGDQEEVLNDMIVLADGRYALLGSTISFGTGTSDIFLVLYNR